MASTEAKVNVAVNGEVEFVVGEKTAAWLVSLGWTPPVETDARDGSAELIEKVLEPSPGLEAAKVALSSREAERKVAQALFYTMGSAVEPGQLRELLEYFGVNMDKFLAPIREVEIPGLSDATSGA